MYNKLSQAFPLDESGKDHQGGLHGLHVQRTLCRTDSRPCFAPGGRTSLRGGCHSNVQPPCVLQSPGGAYPMNPGCLVQARTILSSPRVSPSVWTRIFHEYYILREYHLRKKWRISPVLLYLYIWWNTRTLKSLLKPLYKLQLSPIEVRSIFDVSTNGPLDCTVIPPTIP